MCQLVNHRTQTRTTGPPTAPKDDRRASGLSGCVLLEDAGQGLQSGAVQVAVAVGEGLEAVAFGSVSSAHDAFVVVVGVDGLQDPVGRACPGTDSGVAVHSCCSTARLRSARVRPGP